MKELHNPTGRPWGNCISWNTISNAKAVCGAATFPPGEHLGFCAWGKQRSDAIRQEGTAGGTMLVPTVLRWTVRYIFFLQFLHVHREKLVKFRKQLFIYRRNVYDELFGASYFRGEFWKHIRAYYWYLFLIYLANTWCTHIYAYTHWTIRGKKGSSIAHILSLFLCWRKTSVQYVSPASYNPHSLSHTPVFPIATEHKHTQSNIYWVHRKQAKAPGARAITFLKFRMQNLPTLVQGVQGIERGERDDRWIWTEQSFIRQIDLAHTVAYERSALPQRQPCPPTNEGMESDMTNIDFPRGICFPNTSEVLSQISNQTSAAVCI